MTLPLALVGAAFGTELHLEVHGLANDAGAVVIAVYSEEDDYLSRTTQPSFNAAVPIVDGVASWTIANVVEGRYAFAVFHDENGNGVLDVNLFGIPKEPTAFSNSARALFGPPSFDRAAVWVSGASASTVVSLGRSR